MKNQLEYIQTPAGIVKQFRVINAKLSYSLAKDDFVSAALLAFFQRMSNSDTLDALDQLPSLPQDIAPITIRFLAHWLPCSTPKVAPKITELLRRFMRIPLINGSILEKADRVFNWMERDRLIQLSHMTSRVKMLKSWSAVPIKLSPGVGPIDGNKSEIIITEYVYPGLEMNVFAWEVTVGHMLRGRGTSETLEEAAEETYRVWYKYHTMALGIRANELMADKQVVLLGNTVSSANFLNHWGRKQATIIYGPDRDADMFVLNWPSLAKEKRVFKIKYATTHTIELEGGTKLAKSDHGTFYYTYKPELYIHDEIVCNKCGQLSSVSSVDARYAQGIGMVCGPCRDFMCEAGELSDSTFD